MEDSLFIRFFQHLAKVGATDQPPITKTQSMVKLKRIQVAFLVMSIVLGILAIASLVYYFIGAQMLLTFINPKATLTTTLPRAVNQSENEVKLFFDEGILSGRRLVTETSAEINYKLSVGLIDSI